MLWITVALLLLVELHVGIVRWTLSMVQHTIERYTAPVIQVETPALHFDSTIATHTASLTDGSSLLHPRAAREPNTILCYDKARLVVMGTVPVTSPDDVRAAVQRAREAQKVWCLTSFATRRRLLFALMDYILAHQREICATTALECGKTMIDGTLGELLTTLEKLRWTAAQGEAVLSEERRDVGPMTMHKCACVNYVPFGVVGAIVSWNYPFHNIYGPMISALFAGNGFVGKVSEYSSYYASYYESIVHDGLRQMGYSPHLVRFVTGFAETGQALVSCVDKLTFIGSPEVGRQIMSRAAHTLTPVVLELGGKDPAVVCDDADVAQLIPIIMRGNFQNCGQNCVGLERIVVQDSVHDELVQELTRRVKALRQGPPSQCRDSSSSGSVSANESDTAQFDLGAMTMGRAAVEKVEQLVAESVQAGATLVCGGTALSLPSACTNAANSSSAASSCCYFPPTILTDVTPEMPIAQKEVFGPVLVVMKFRTDAEAIAMVNACPYALGSSVFSSNAVRAQFIADRLRTGMVNINDFGINYLCQSLPFGGVGLSGFDRFAGREGLRGNCIVRASTKDRFPGVKTVIPSVLQYPITPAAFRFMEKLSFMLYGRAMDMFRGALGLAFLNTNSKPKCD